jgi:hypothetical protein
MELSDEQISRIWDAHTVPVFGKTGINPIVFARAIEAEVRKGDTELIRQLVEALEQSHATLWEEDDDPARPVHEAIVAGRARLEKP